MFRYGIATARCDRDVAADLRGALTTPKTTHHAAITDPDEVGVLLKSMDGYTGQEVTRMALRLSPHLFVRPGELRQAEWTEIDVSRANWSIPAERMKMRRPHKVQLSRQALAMIKELREISGHRQYLFPCMGNPRRRRIGRRHRHDLGGQNGCEDCNALHDILPVRTSIRAPGRPAPPSRGGRLRIYWDRSLSHRSARTDLEANVLARLAERTVPAAVDLVTFASDRPQVTTLGNATALKAALAQVTYRGGTSLAGLNALALPAATQCVLVSDGEVSIDRGASFAPECRLVALTAAPGANGARLGLLSCSRA